MPMGHVSPQNFQKISITHWLTDWPTDPLLGDAIASKKFLGTPQWQNIVIGKGGGGFTSWGKWHPTMHCIVMMDPINWSGDLLVMIMMPMMIMILMTMVTSMTMVGDQAMVTVVAMVTMMTWMVSTLPSVSFASAEFCPFHIPPVWCCKIEIGNLLFCRQTPCRVVPARAEQGLPPPQFAQFPIGHWSKSYHHQFCISFILHISCSSVLYIALWIWWYLEFDIRAAQIRYLVSFEFSFCGSSYNLPGGRRCFYLPYSSPENRMAWPFWIHLFPTSIKTWQYHHQEGTTRLFKLVCFIFFERRHKRSILWLFQLHYISYYHWTVLLDNLLRSLQFNFTFLLSLSLSCSLFSFHCYFFLLSFFHFHFYSHFFTFLLSLVPFFLRFFTFTFTGHGCHLFLEPHQKNLQLVSSLARVTLVKSANLEWMNDWLTE